MRSRLAVLCSALVGSCGGSQASQTVPPPSPGDESSVLDRIRESGVERVWANPDGDNSWPPILLDSLVVLESGGRLVARRRTDGTEVWSAEAKGVPAPVGEGGKLVWVDPHGQVVVADAATGRVRCEVTFPAPALHDDPRFANAPPEWPRPRPVPVVEGLALRRDQLLVSRFVGEGRTRGAMQHSLVSMESCQVRWTVDAGAAYSNAVLTEAGALFAEASSETVANGVSTRGPESLGMHALEDGQAIWRIDVPGGTVGPLHARIEGDALQLIVGTWMLVLHATTGIDRQAPRDLSRGRNAEFTEQAGAFGTFARPNPAGGADLVGFRSGDRHLDWNVNGLRQVSAHVQDISAFAMLLADEGSISTLTQLVMPWLHRGVLASDGVFTPLGRFGPAKTQVECQVEEGTLRVNTRPPISASAIALIDGADRFVCLSATRFRLDARTPFPSIATGRVGFVRFVNADESLVCRVSAEALASLGPMRAIVASDPMPTRLVEREPSRTPSEPWLAGVAISQPCQ